MPRTSKAVIARATGEPVETVMIRVPDPGPGEAVVRVQACGVCHTDLHYREGSIGDDFPYLLGHEAAGLVEQVGDGVTEVQPGDFVILNWRAVCGQCRACRRGRPWYCFSTHNARQKMTLADGEGAGIELSPALGIGAFTEFTLVAAGQCTKVDAAASAAAAGLLGCGIMAGLGAAINTGGVGRGDSIAVIGCGGVGVAAIAGANMAGARTIIAVDLDDRKLVTATRLGATHTVNAGTHDVVQAVRDLTDGNGADVVVDAVGRPETWKQAFYARDLAGTSCTGWRSHPGGDDPGDPAARRVRPRRLAQVVLVRRLLAVQGLPDADRPVPARTVAAGCVRQREDRHRRRGVSLRQDARRRGAPLCGAAVTEGASQGRSEVRAQPRGADREAQQTIGNRAAVTEGASQGRSEVRAQPRGADGN